MPSAGKTSNRIKTFAEFEKLFFPRSYSEAQRDKIEESVPLGTILAQQSLERILRKLK